MGCSIQLPPRSIRIHPVRVSRCATSWRYSRALDHAGLRYAPNAALDTIAVAMSVHTHAGRHASVNVIGAMTLATNRPPKTSARNIVKLAMNSKPLAMRETGRPTTFGNLLGSNGTVAPGLYRSMRAKIIV